VAERIDLIQEFVGLFNQEEMVAFFDFTCPIADTVVHGLCRISKPKSTSMPYLSLSFMIDTPVESMHRGIESVLSRLEGNALPAAAPMITSVVSMPVETTRSEAYVRQVDVMLEERVDPGRFFIEQRLVPALHQVTGIVAGEIVWWGELAEEGQAPAPADVAKPAEGGLAGRLKRFLSGS
jgi:hypothetical protein